MKSTEPPVQTHSRGEIIISTDRARLDLETVHDFLTHSYWAKGIPRATLERAIENSLCFGIYDGKRQVGFARVISDFATYAYLADVFVIQDHRSRGLASWLMECIAEHPALQGLRRWTLATRDAHGLYAKFGFTPLDAPDRWMERHDAEVYARSG
jgi:N-acetylglutamate synthase-like GNAT family acetyltransferase